MEIIRILLTIFFGWSLVKTASLFFRSDSLDRLVFEAVGLSWLFWILLLCSVAGSAIAIVYLWRPSDLTYRLAIVGVLLDLLLTVIGTGIGMTRPELLKEAFVASREERGLPVREEVLAMMDNPVARVFPLVVGVVIAGVCIGLLVWTRKKSRTH